MSVREARASIGMREFRLWQVYFMDKIKREAGEKPLIREPVQRMSPDQIMSVLFPHGVKRG